MIAEQIDSVPSLEIEDFENVLSSVLKDLQRLKEENCVDPYTLTVVSLFKHNCSYLCGLYVEATKHLTNRNIEEAFGEDVVKLVYDYFQRLYCSH